ncbi:MAG: glycosyltransferase [Muribaculaceae bacterium]|nr:glycosyltransferase [Muribaculaceae bacterium]
MANLPELTIIVPVYRVESYLKECLDSILGQTFQNFELILVDDGSPDNSGSICDEYALKFPEKIKVIHQTNGGLSSARNAGLEIARGEYIGFVDSDDAILPEMYETLLKAMRANDADIVFSQTLHWNKQKKTGINITESHNYSGIEVFIRLLQWEESVAVWNKVFKRDILQSVRFLVGKTNEDFPFISQLLLENPKVTILPDGFYRYRVTPGSITNVLRPAFFDIFQNIALVESLLPKDELKLHKALNDYAVTLHTMSVIKIKKIRKTKEYPDWLKANKRFVRRHLANFLFNPHFSLRWKIKALYASF